MQQQLLTLDRRVQLKPYQPRLIKPREYMTDAEIDQYVGDTLVIDTENYLNYFLIAMKHIRTGKVITFELGEWFNERKLSWIMHNYLTVGFNTHKFDLPLLWLSYYNQNLAVLKEATDKLIFGMYPAEFAKEYHFAIPKTNHIDLIEICPGIHSLKLYMARLHSERIQDLPFNPNGTITNEQIEIVKDYCFNDLDGTQELFIFNKDRIQLREELGRDFNTDLRSKSDAQMAEAMVASELKKITGFWPKKANLDERRSFSYVAPTYLQFATLSLIKLYNDVCSTEFSAQYGQLSKPAIFSKYYFMLGKLQYKFGIGGLHSCEETVSYRSNSDYLLIDRDVASYYPAIIINQGLYPKHLGRNFLDVYTRMRDDRIYAKKSKLFAKDKGLKIALNGVSGKFNSEHSICYDPQCYLQMTLTGQLSVLMLAEMFECNGIQVISANTDGIVSYCPQSRYEEMLKWIAYWEQMTGFVTEETKYSAYYARDINAYFAVKNDGSVKVKGPYSEVGSQTGTKLDNNPIHLVCTDAVSALLAKGIPIEKTIRECRDISRFIVVRNVTGGAHKDGNYLGKTIRWYYAFGCAGTINSIKSGNKIPETDSAKPIMDLPREFPQDINYAWYIEKTIEILYEISYLKRAKQRRLI